MNRRTYIVHRILKRIATSTDERFAVYSSGAETEVIIRCGSWKHFDTCMNLRRPLLIGVYGRDVDVQDLIDDITDYYGEEA